MATRTGVVPPELTDALAKIDTETTALAAVVTDLRAKIKTTMTAEEVSAVTTTLGSVADRLKGIATDPDAVIPPGPTPVFRNR